MRKEPNLRIDSYRKTHPTIGGSTYGVDWGYFEIGSLRVMSSGRCDGNEETHSWEQVMP